MLREFTPLECAGHERDDRSIRTFSARRIDRQGNSLDLQQPPPRNIIGDEPAKRIGRTIHFGLTLTEMVFASFSFIFVFLPIALVGYYLVAKLGADYAVGWLVLASLVFYAVWNPVFVVLLLCSIAFNFAIGRAMLAREGEAAATSRNRLFVLGVAANLTVLFSFKYLGPILAWGHSLSLVSPRFDFNIILPLGISFFTFTQIGYLVDCDHGRGKDL